MITVEAFKAHVGSTLFNNWRSYVMAHTADLQGAINLYEAVFTSAERSKLTDTIIHQNLDGATLNLLVALTPTQVLSIYTSLRRRSNQYAPADGLSNAEIRTLIGRCLPALDAKKFLRCAVWNESTKKGIKWPRFLYNFTGANWNSALKDDQRQRNAMQCLAKAIAATGLVDPIIEILNKAEQLGVHRPNRYDLVCNLLALIPKTPGTIKDNILNFLGESTPQGGWANLFDLANQFVRSGRKRAAAGPTQFKYAGEGVGAVLHRVHFHSDKDARGLSMQAMFEPESDAQSKLNATVRVHAGRVRHFCNGHTMRHCNFSQRIESKSQQFDFFPERTAHADLLAEMATLFGAHSGDLQAGIAKLSTSSTTAYFDAHDRELGLFLPGNGSKENIALNHYKPSTGDGITVTKALLSRLQYLFDTVTYDESL